MKKRILSLVLVIILMATFAGSALAGPPTHDSWEAPLDVTVDCGDFDIVLDNTMRISVTYFDDDNNNPMSYKYQIQFSGTLTNTGTRTVHEGIDTINGRRFWTGGRDEHGLYYHITVPGEGVVALAVGRIVWDDDGEISFISGQGFEEMFVYPGEEAWLCETLADY